MSIAITKGRKRSMRKPFHVSLSLAALFACFSLMGCQTTAPSSEVDAVNGKPANVLLILVDDYRTAMGAMGDPYAITPNIDALASQGMLFQRAYANVPVCGASRASLMTSIYPHKTRFVNYLANAEREVPNAATLPSVFKDAGYYTVSNGKVFHDPRDSDEESWSERAWEPAVKGPAYFAEESKRYVKPSDRFGDRGPWYEGADKPDEAYYDGQVKAKTVADLKRLAARDEPFFLAAGFRRPHLPFNAPQKYFDLHEDTDFLPSAQRGSPAGAPDGLKGSGEIHLYHFKGEAYNSDEFHRQSLLGYYAAVSFIDQQVGEIVSTLDELGLRENTIIVLTSDHGFHLGEYNFWGKHNTLTNALHIPLIIDAPGTRPASAPNALVSLVDLFPTMLELAGIKGNAELKEQMVGASFAAVLEDPNSGHKDYLYSRFKEADTVISGDMIYTQYLSADGEEQAMLFDLRKDPGETVNLAADPAYQADVARLSKRLRAFIAQSEGYAP
jgi:arylsulfatase A-like enzyme